MNPNEERTLEQQQAFDTVYNSRRLLLEWGTGVGKSRVGVRLVERLHAEGRGRILLLVAETPHKENWRMEFTEYLGEEKGNELYRTLVVECYNSFKKYARTTWDAIIADEAHHLRSPKRLEILESVRTEWFLALSATISDRGDGEQLLDTLTFNFGPFEDLKIGLEEAIDAGLLPEPIIDVRAVEMSEKTSERYKSMNEYYNACKENYDRLRAERGLRYGDPEDPFTQDAKDKWMHAGSQRKLYMGTLKTWEAKRLLGQLAREGKRTICFCASIKQIEKLGGKNIINSKKSVKANKETIDKFNDHEIDSLFVVGMLKEGQNLKDIDAGIIVQLDGKERPFIQRFGRVMRSKHPYLYIIYIPGTRDEEYLQNVLAERNPDHIIGYDMTKETREESVPEFFFPSTFQAPRAIDIRHISEDALAGPWINLQDLRRSYPLTDITIRQGEFQLHCNGMTAFSRRVTGLYYGVSVEPLKETVKLYLWLETNGTLGYVEMPWYRAMSPLMQLANEDWLYHKRITLSAFPDGNEAKIRLMEGDTMKSWISNTIPPRMGEDIGQQLNFVNCLVEDVTRRFKQEKTGRS